MILFAFIFNYCVGWLTGRWMWVWCLYWAGVTILMAHLIETGEKTMTSAVFPTSWVAWFGLAGYIVGFWHGLKARRENLT